MVFRGKIVTLVSMMSDPDLGVLPYHGILSILVGIMASLQANFIKENTFPRKLFFMSLLLPLLHTLDSQPLSFS